MADFGSTTNLAAQAKPAADPTSSTTNQPAETESIRKNFNYPLVRVRLAAGDHFWDLANLCPLSILSFFSRHDSPPQICDMIDEMRAEAVDMVVTAVEKHPGNFEVPFLLCPDRGRCVNKRRVCCIVGSFH